MVENKGNWFRKHWILTMIIIVIFVLIVINILYRPLDKNNLTGNVVQNTQEEISKEPEIPKETTYIPEEEISGYSNTQAGATLIFEGYKFIKIGENYGKITDLTFSLINQGGGAIYPYFYLQVYGSSAKNEKSMPLIPLNKSSELSHRTIPIDLIVGNINEIKNIKLAVYDGASFYGFFVVSVNFKTNLTEGFKIKSDF